MPENSNLMTFTMSSGEILSIPKHMQYSSTQGNWTMYAKLAYADGLGKLYGALMNTDGYDPAEAATCILSGEEVAMRADPHFRSDYIAFARPELDTDLIDTLDKGEKEARFAQFISLCQKAAEPEMMELMIYQAVKKKNGSLYNNRVRILAAMPVVFGRELDFFELCAKAINDTTLEVIVRCCKFSESEWENCIVSALIASQTIKSEESAKKTIKLSMKLKTNFRDEMITVRVPVVKTDDGKLSLDTLPHRALSDFNCLTGTDETGYEINVPIDQSIYSINSRKLDISVYADGQLSYRREALYWEDLLLVSRYIRTKDKKLRAAFERICFGIGFSGKIPERYLEESFIAEYAFCILCCIEHKNEILTRRRYAQKFADNMERERTGLLCTGVPNSTAARTADIDLLNVVPGRKKPLIHLWLHCLVAGPRELEWCAILRLCEDDSWTGYDPNCKNTAFPSKLSLIQNLDEQAKNRFHSMSRESDKQGWMMNYGHLLEKPAASELAGKTVVFNCGTPIESQRIKVEACGAFVRKSVSSKTDYLIVRPGEGSKKEFSTALELKKAGNPIKFIHIGDIDKLDAHAKPASADAPAIESDFLIAAKTLKKYCGSAEAVVVPDGVNRIGVGAFSGSCIRSVRLNAGVGAISQRAFEDCRKLEEAELPEGLKKIGSDAFRLSGLKAVTIPDSVAELSSEAFEGCISLKYVHLGSGVQEIGIAAFARCAMEKVHIPASVKKIKHAAFRDCLYLKEVELNEGLEEICSKAFVETGLVDVVIPKTVKSISGDAFAGCRDLRTIRIEGNATAITDGIDIIPKAKFIVPAGSLSEEYCVKYGAKFERY